MTAFVLAVYLATAVWVGFDASKLGVQKGRLGGGSLDMSVPSWVVCTFFLWIIAFPCYLVARGRYHVMDATAKAYRDLAPSPMYGPGLSLTATVGWPQPSPGAYQVQLPPQAGSPSLSAPSLSAPSLSAPVHTAVPIAPPQLSADGQWWWDGWTWAPAGAAAANRPR